MPLLELAEITLVGIVLAVLSIPPTLGWVPRNRMYGFRVPATLRTDPVWYAINRRFGWELIAIGACLAATGAAFDAAGEHSPRPVDCQRRAGRVTAVDDGARMEGGEPDGARPMTTMASRARISVESCT